MFGTFHWNTGNHLYPYMRKERTVLKPNFWEINYFMEHCLDAAVLSDFQQGRLGSNSGGEGGCRPLAADFQGVENYGNGQKIQKPMTIFYHTSRLKKKKSKWEMPILWVKSICLCVLWLENKLVTRGDRRRPPKNRICWMTSNIK